MSVPAAAGLWEGVASRLKAVWREGWAVLAILVFADLAVLAWKLAASSPGGVPPLLRFAGIALAVTVLPGLGLAAAAGHTAASLSGRIAAVLGLSLAATSAVTFTAYAAGVYTRVFVLTMLCVFSIWGLSALRSLSIRGTVAEIRASWQGQGVVERLAIVFFIVYFHNMLCETVVLPFTFWDAIVSWDKWGCDMAERQALGGYSFGGYPQLVPALYSVFYKISGTCTQSYPDEQLLLHGFLVVFPLILLLGIVSVCAHFKLPWALPALLVFSHGEFQRWVQSGMVDIPVVAVTTLGWSMVLGAAEKSLVSDRGGLFRGINFGLILYAVGFTKGNGIPWVLFFSLYLGLLVLTGGRARPSRRALAAGAATIVLTLLPFYGRQYWLSGHQDAIDHDPRLHSFTVEISRPRMFTTDLAVVKAHVINLGRGVESPFKAQAWKILCGTVLLLVLLSISRSAHVFWLIAFCIATLVWFRTSSYDYRNLLVVFPFVAVLFALGLRELLTLFRVHARWWVGGVQACLVLLYSGSFLVAELKGIRRRPELGFWRRPAHERLAVYDRHWSQVRDIVTGSAALNAGRYVYTATPLYRHLGERGVYTIKPFTFSRTSRGDVMLRKQEPLLNGFVPVSMLMNRDFTFIDLFEPELAPATWHAVEATGVVLEPRDGGALVVSGVGTVVLEVDELRQAAVNSSSVLSLVCERASPQDSLRLHPDSARLAPLDDRMRSVWHGNSLNLLFWLSRIDDAHGGPLRFLLVKRSEASLVVTGVRVLRQQRRPATALDSAAERLPPRRSVAG